MADLTPTDMPEPCCSPEEQATCCEATQKADCCSDGDRCGCDAGRYALPARSANPRGPR